MSRAHSPTFPSLHLRHSLFSNPSVVLSTSQLILQPFRCFTYVTAHSPKLLSLHLCHRFFTYVTWRAAHGLVKRSSVSLEVWFSSGSAVRRLFLSGERTPVHTAYDQDVGLTTTNKVPPLSRPFVYQSRLKPVNRLQYGTGFTRFIFLSGERCPFVHVLL